MHAMDAFSHASTHPSSWKPHPPEHSEPVRVHLRMQLSRDGRADAELDAKGAADAGAEAEADDDGSFLALALAVSGGAVPALAPPPPVALAVALDADGLEDPATPDDTDADADAARFAFSGESHSPLRVWQAESAETRMFPSGRFSRAAEHSEPDTRHRSLSSQVIRSNARLSEKGASVADIPSRPMCSSAALSPEPVAGRS